MGGLKHGGPDVLGLLSSSFDTPTQHSIHSHTKRKQEIQSNVTIVLYQHARTPRAFTPWQATWKRAQVPTSLRFKGHRTAKCRQGPIQFWTSKGMQKSPPTQYSARNTCRSGWAICSREINEKNVAITKIRVCPFGISPNPRSVWAIM